MKTVDLTPLLPVLNRYHGLKQDALLPLLHEAQSIYGWLPREVQIEISKTLKVPLAEIHGVIEFYSMFYNEPKPKRKIRVCEDIACQLAGARRLKAVLEQGFYSKKDKYGENIEKALEFVPCLGLCDIAPAALDGHNPIGKLSPANVPALLAGDLPGTNSKSFGEPRLILESIEPSNPISLSDYERRDGFKTLRKVLEMEPEFVIQLIDDSGILGRGGAMFPLGRKWRFTRGTQQEAKHLIVNADESEPGTFKDRIVMEGDPFSIIEAAIIAGYVVGAGKGWIFVRGEYQRSFSRLKEAVIQARNAGYLGENILDKNGFDFDIELRLGAGAYICGEETASFEAIEGKRGFPRIKPPFPTTNGLFDQPTAINNVETLVAGLAALRIGIEEWRRLGTQQSPGTKLFCLSGHVKKPGVYEVPFGRTIQDLITMAGGVPGSRKIQAVLVGGAAGVFVGPEMLEMPLTYEDARANDVPLGSGVILVFNDETEIHPILRQIAHFFAHESCGKCFPCQLGTQRQFEILDQIARDGVKPTDKQALLDIGLAMTETSLCGLGQTASIAVKSAFDLWPEVME